MAQEPPRSKRTEGVELQPEGLHLHHKLSKTETAYHATWIVASMNMVKNHFDEILRYAVKKEEIRPKSNRNQSGFSRLIIMERKIKGVGTAKLTVGVRICDNRKEQYCITAI